MCAQIRKGSIRLELVRPLHAIKVAGGAALTDAAARTPASPESPAVTAWAMLPMSVVPVGLVAIVGLRRRRYGGWDRSGSLGL